MGAYDALGRREGGERVWKGCKALRGEAKLQGVELGLCKGTTAV